MDDGEDFQRYAADAASLVVSVYFLIFTMGQDSAD